MSISSISQTIDRALTSAGLNTSTGPMKAVAATIEKALAAAGLAKLRVPAADHAPPAFRAPSPAADGSPLAGESQPVVDTGQFLSLSHAGSKGSRAYRLYVPAAYAGEPMPLIVMLHGCKQNPVDFATGTQMNALAEREGFLVAYPAQTARENGANCWNWFDSAQQSRAGVEPSLIAGIVSDIGEAYQVDASRVFVAGLSAGAAMAVILGATYPEVFAGVAAHSGLPVGAAHDVPSAFAAMHGRAAPPKAAPGRPPVPTIVFHGDADATVTRANGRAIVEQSVLAHAQAQTTLREQPRPSVTIDGKAVTRTDYIDPDGRHRVEEWVVHGGAHTWFGGNSKGSYTDPTGPDASAEIVRFFLQQRPKAPRWWS